MFPGLLVITCAAPPIIYSYVASDNPSFLLQSLVKCRHAGLYFRIVGRHSREHAHATHTSALLRARHQRPCHRRTAKQRDELAPFHSITSSASASSLGGIVRSSALAVLRLIRNSNLVACTTGRSAGFAPLRIRPV